MTDQEKSRFITQFDKNSAEKVKVFLNRYRGNEYIDIRVWTKSLPGEDGGENPSRKGITLHVELLPDLLRALKEAEEAIG